MVEDIEAWRCTLVSIVESGVDLEIVCQVADGETAVKKAAELKPELILLDIGIPRLNGLEAAKEIGKLPHTPKIIFVTQELSPEVVNEAFRIGASGFVAKMNAGTELLLAVDTVLRGGRFISRCVAPLELSSSDSFPRLPSEVHEVGFYTDDSLLLCDMIDFVARAIESGRACIVIATESHQSSLIVGLKRQGLDVESAIEKGTLVPVDVVQAISEFVTNGMLNESLFLKTVGDLIATVSNAAAKQDGPVAIYGEGADILRQQGNLETAIQVEKLVHVLDRRYRLEILCGYSVGVTAARMTSQVMERISAEHSASHYA